MLLMLFFFLIARRQPRSTLFPYTTLFRSDGGRRRRLLRGGRPRAVPQRADRKSTRLNSSHGSISYAVFCLKKKNITLILFAPQQLAHLAGAAAVSALNF